MRIAALVTKHFFHNSTICNLYITTRITNDISEGFVLIFGPVITVYQGSSFTRNETFPHFSRGFPLI